MYVIDEVEVFRTYFTFIEILLLRVCVTSFSRSVTDSSWILESGKRPVKGEDSLWVRGEVDVGGCGSLIGSLFADHREGSERLRRDLRREERWKMN